MMFAEFRRIMVKAFTIGSAIDSTSRRESGNLIGLSISRPRQLVRFTFVEPPLGCGDDGPLDFAPQPFLHGFHCAQAETIRRRNPKRGATEGAFRGISQWRRR